MLLGINLTDTSITKKNFGMSNLKLVIRDVEGIEFYTDATTGKSGISQAGLAKLCGVNRRTISDLIKSLSGQSKKGEIDESLEAFVGKLFENRTETETGMVLLSGELSATIIEHYAFKGRKPAQFSLRKFAAIGFNTWVQSIIGWQAPQTQSQAPQPPQLPTPEQTEFMKSRAWEKAELEGKPMSSNEIARAAGLPPSNGSALTLPDDSNGLDYADKMRCQYEQMEIQKWFERSLQ